MRKKGWAGTLRRDQRGATVIEFALVALPFVAMILATLQTGLVFFAQQCLDSTAEQTARQLMTGAAQKAGTDQAGFKKIACQNLPSFLSCANVMIDVQSAAQFSDVDTTAPTLKFDRNAKVLNTWQFAPGGPESVVVMRIMYLLPVVGAPFGFDLSTTADRRRLLISTFVFKSEPYAL